MASRRRLSHLMEIAVNMAGDSDLRPLLNMPDLRSVWLNHVGTPVDFASLSALPSLRYVSFQAVTELPPIEEWTLPAGLEYLGASPLSGDVDLSALVRFPRLSSVRFTGSATLRNVAALRVLPLRQMAITECEVEGGLDAVATAAAGLTWFSLYSCDWSVDLGPLARLVDLQNVRITNCPGSDDFASLNGLPRLESLLLNGVPVSDISFVTRSQTLRALDFERCPNLTDLRPLARLTKLRRLSLLGNQPGLDLSPLVGMRGLIVELYEGQIVVGTERLGRGVRIERVVAPEGYDPYAPIVL